MIKRFCDACGDEITDSGAATGYFEHTVLLKDTPVRLQFQVITAVDGTWNGGHICTNCVRDGITDGDEVSRP